MPGAKSRLFQVAFDSVDAFATALGHHTDETGFFFSTGRDIPVGADATVRVDLRPVKTPVVLQGRVAWRRTRAARDDLPAGVFVRLTERDRARIDGLIRFLRDSKSDKDRRHDRRIPVDLPASYQTAEGEYPSLALNLSRGGAFLRCSGPLLTVGARFPVKLVLNGDQRKAVELTSRVAWIDLFGETKGMGVQFECGQSGLRQVLRALRRLERTGGHS